MRKAASRVLIALFLIALVLVSTTQVTANSDSKQVFAKALTDHECNSSEWHFVITQIDSHDQAPATINVKWANGNSEVVSKEKYTGQTAHYTTKSNLNSSVTQAYTYIYNGWGGQFNLSHGPCGQAQPTATPVVTASPTAAPTTNPTQRPIASPTVAPTASPTVAPTVEPTTAPTANPTINPTVAPTQAPTTAPTATPVVTVEPTATPAATVRTDLTDGRKDSLDCVPESQNGRKECNDVKVTPVVAGVSTDRELPSTGSTGSIWGVISLFSLVGAIYIKTLMRKEERALETELKKGKVIYAEIK